MILGRILVCIAAFGVFVYAYIDKQNAVTKRRLEIPVIAKEIRELKETNARLQYEIDLFESPEHLMQLASHNEFCHLKQPLLKEILTMEEGLALEVPAELTEEKVAARPKMPLAIGTKQ